MTNLLHPLAAASAIALVAIPGSVIPASTAAYADPAAPKNMGWLQCSDWNGDLLVGARGTRAVYRVPIPN